MKTIANSTSKEVAKYFLLFKANEGKYTNGKFYSAGNTHIRRNNDVVTIEVSGKTILTATPNAITGEYDYEVDLRNSTALNRIVGIQEALDWDFSLIWHEGCCYIKSKKEGAEPKKVGRLKRLTKQQLSDIANS